jgi:hypothetical protein
VSWREIAMRTVFVVLLLLAPSLPAFSADDPMLPWRNGGPRVRPADDRTATLLRAGLDRSPTFRTLIDRIEDNEVIVYVEIQRRLRTRLAGCLTWVADGGRYRYVRASIQRATTQDQQIATIAHELQHVLEIIQHPNVRSEASLAALYKQIGDRKLVENGLWDTEGARDIGNRVRRELSLAPVVNTVSVGTAVSPLEWHSWYRQQRTQD